ncbi:hypothetical protein C2G38_2037259 [Gigaspora rosea]|uniref:C3H1-type domain-containing protein n=1 Tax=Gigaspora rosea TaxID=44941 RepID=A0A397V8L6_9GLOM|nr:hypothetical protein C2G38_2037259 [Gigaspora rosea]
MENNTNSKASDEPTDHAASTIDISRIDAQQQKTLYQQQDAGHNHTFNATTTQHKEKQTKQGSPSQQDNCPLTPLLNNLILNTATTQTRQKALEMLPNKPNLPPRLWKAIAIRNYVDLAEFRYKSLKANMKYNDEDHSLQTSEGGVIAIRKRSHPQKFTDIAEWLLAFRAYMEAILIIYDLREQELNAYRDHINTLCIKQEFSAVAAYDEDQRLHLTTNRDSTLFERNIEAEGENFDVTTTKKQHTIANPRNAKRDITWQDRRQICINWNRKGCSDDNNCKRVHACLICKKIGHPERRCFFNKQASPKQMDNRNDSTK